MKELCNTIKAAGWEWLVRSDENNVFFANVTVKQHHQHHFVNVPAAGQGCCFPKFADTAEAALQASWDECRKFHGLA